MKIILIEKSNSFYKYDLPFEANINYWLKDKDNRGEFRDILLVNKENNIYKLHSSENAKIMSNNTFTEEINLEENKEYQIKMDDYSKCAFLFTYPDFPINYNSYSINSSEIEISLGSSTDRDIIIDNVNISEQQLTLIYKNNNWSIKNNNPLIPAFVNEELIVEGRICNGDQIFISGYKIIIINKTIYIYSMDNKITINPIKLTILPAKMYPTTLTPSTPENDSSIEINEEYFNRAPRFTTSIETEEVVIDSPPEPEKVNETPIIYTIGPMITMSMTSAVTGATALINVQRNGSSITQALPTLIISACMLLTMILWPSLMKKYEKKQKIKKEQLRQTKYSDYLASVQRKIDFIKKSQHQILLNNYIDPKSCQNIIVNRKRNLWERKIEHDDFLNLRVGIGSVPAKIDLKYSTEKFTLDDDNLKTKLYNLVDIGINIAVSPVTVSLVERKNLVVVGDKTYRISIIENLILQIVTFHSNEEVKMVFFSSDDNIWERYESLSYCWSNSRTLRYFATNYEEMTNVSFHLEQEYNKRKYKDEESKEETKYTYLDFKPYYIIFVNNIEKARNVEIISKVLNEERNLGFSIVVMSDGISDLPDECNNFIMADGDKSAIITNDLNKNNQQGFIADSTSDVNYDLCFEKVSNIPIKFLDSEMQNLKKSIGFLEMYNVGNVEQLNSALRWENSKPMNSLSFPVGINSNSEIFSMDLHEKYYGPHGLIAGMTGSGKSEFIITMILSMAINYHPYEVSFILIDYKGGGLAGAFDNKEKGIKLPHLAGTITNLDTVELNRSFASIQSELKRRQKLFNDARNVSDESTIDIYKYQKLYREKKVSVPISHLFIISDEFAELKSQQPEFMDQLISTARIGRSLGVHLILATQKPSGVVNDQIWSNSKFRVCLKVQDKSDSMEIIKCPDAASIKNPGRFYLQVGYNDYFGLGQAAWCGGPYYPREKLKKKIDKSLSIVDNVGNIINSIDIEEKETIEAQGEELGNIVKYISRISEEKNINVPQLWLESIPAVIYVKDLIKKYSYCVEKHVINPIIGEYDNPNNQSQHLLTLDLSGKGNTIIYGSSGSGKEIQLTTILYSMMLYNTTSEINVYIIDFGSGILKMFKNAPQVGDIVIQGEDEKIENIFKMIEDSIENRKKEFEAYNGDYNFYYKQVKNPKPRIIFIINNYESFVEDNEEIIDRLVYISREGLRYGIIMILTCNSANGIRYKIVQNFLNQIVLQFNDTGDYSAVYGKTNGMIPSNIVGRGLVKIDKDIFEYQTAYAYDWNNINLYINAVCEKLSNNQSIRADEIPVLPNVVQYNDVKEKLTGLSQVPVGISKESLDVVTYDFTKQNITLLSSEDTEEIKPFVSSLIALFKLIPNIFTIVIDPLETVSCQSTSNCNYVVDITDVKMEELFGLIENNNTMVILSNYDTIKSKINSDNKKKLEEIIKEKENKTKFLLIDTPSNIKKIEYDDFYKSSVNSNYGIWVGSGFGNQISIKCNNITKIMRDTINIDMGFIITKGSSKYVKFINFMNDKK